MTYSEKLKDSRWIAKRKEALEYYGGCNCFGCGSCNDLQVHHKMYTKWREPWEYDVTELAILCKHCHSAFHENKTKLTRILSNSRLFYSYEFGKIIEVIDWMSDIDTNDYYDIVTYVKTKQKPTF
jgi:5-methylcytosine-specific restriction endonuclease McrA